MGDNLINYNSTIVVYKNCAGVYSFMAANASAVFILPDKYNE